MKYIKTSNSWLDNLLPNGLPIKTSTLISGPGRAGKLTEMKEVAENSRKVVIPTILKI